MPIFTRRSRASTLQIISARLSENGTMVTFALDTSFLRHTSTSWHWGLRKVWRHCGSGFLAHDRYSHAGNCIGLPSNTGLFLSTGNRYLFLLQRHSIPFDSWPLLLFQFSRVWRQSFAIEVSDLYSSSPLSSIFDNWASISSDESPCRTIPIQFWVAKDSRILNLYRLSKTSSDGIFDIDSRTSSHFVSKSWMLSLWRLTENINRRNQYCIMSASHSKVVVDHEGDLSSS